MTYSHFENLVVNIILLIGFNLVNLVILLTLVLRIWLSIWFYSFVLTLWIHMIYSRYENLVVIMILLIGFNLVDLIIWLTLIFRIWSSIWFYSLKFNLMWRFYSYWDFHRLLGFTRWLQWRAFFLIFFFFCIVNKAFRFSKRTTLFMWRKKSPYSFLLIK